MNPSPFEALAAAFVDRLGAASLLAAFAVTALWLLCRLRPSIAPATRSALWWGVSFAILVRLLPMPVLAIEVPSTWAVAALWPIVAPAPAPTPAPASVAGRPTATWSPAVSALAPDVAWTRPAATAPRSPARPAVSATTASPAPWRFGVVLIWAFVVGLLFIRLGVSALRLRRIIASAEPAPAAIAAEATSLAIRLGLASTPPVRISDRIDAPQVAGVWRPTLLLPASLAAGMTADERAMTLCHELAHVRRRDLALAWAPALAERLLFFHPAARIVAREYALAREAACDAEVLQHLGAAPRDYGRLLLRLGVTRRPAALAAAQSSPSADLLRRRLAMLNRYTPPRPPRGAWILGVLLVVLSLPLSLVARQDRMPLPPVPPMPPAAPRPASADLLPLPPVPPAAPRQPSADLLPLPPVPPVPPAAAIPDVPPAVPTPTSPDQAPPPPPPPPARPARAALPPPPPPPPPDGFSWVQSSNGETFVLIDGTGSHGLSGHGGDAEEARRLRGASDGPFLYYRAGGRAYVSRDRALIDRVKKEMRAQQELGAEQGALGARQAELGAEQAALGHEQGALSMRHHEVAAAMAADHIEQSQIAALEGSLAALEMRTEGQSAEVIAARKAVREAIEALRQAGASSKTRDYEEEARAKANRMGDVRQRHQDFGRRQAELGARQAELGRMQAELGAKQRAAYDAARQRILAILEDARAKGQVEAIR